MTSLRLIACLALATTACKGDNKAPGEPTPGSAAPVGSAAPAPPPPPPAVDAAAAAPATAAKRLEVTHLSKPIPVEAQVPVGWTQREGITTWDPPEQDLPMWHRSYEITATCDGGCTPAELEKKLPRYIDAYIASKKQPNMSGNAEQDAKAIAPVKELERGELPQGGQFVFLRVEKPPEFAKDPYPDVFAGICVHRRPTDEHLVVTKVQAAPDDEKVWWPVLVAACKATKVAE